MTAASAAVVARHPATRPTAFQTGQVREIVRGLGESSDLLLVYVQKRVPEAAWICAQARARGVAVRLAAVADSAHAVLRKVHAEARHGSMAIVLADMTLALPPDVIHLAGTESVSPIDLWRPRSTLDAQAQDLAARLAPPLTAGGLTVSFQPWRMGDGVIEADVIEADGVFVADGAIAINRPVNWDARLSARPVRLTVQSGLITAVECPDPHLHRFLGRAVHTHLANRVLAVRAGAHPVACGFGAVAGPVNERHPGFTLRLCTDARKTYSSASADLCIDLTGPLP